MAKIRVLASRCLCQSSRGRVFVAGQARTFDELLQHYKSVRISFFLQSRQRDAVLLSETLALCGDKPRPTRIRRCKSQRLNL